MSMTMHPVDSSQIESVGHDGSSKLRVKFKSSGATYEYDNVSPQDFAAFKGADSVGSHFHKVIKPNVTKYPFKKL